MKAVLLPLCGLLALAAPAGAASPDAWAALFAKAGAACVKASELKAGTVLGKPVDFPDRVLVLVRGRWPQPHMNNAQATFACLYDKKAGTAEAQELTGLP